MKQFVGGITNSSDQVQLTLQIAGGSAYTRVYDNDVAIAINKLCAIHEALIELSLDGHADIVFYIDQLTNLFRSTNIEFLHGSAPYQNIHNAKILKVYLSYLSRKFNAPDILDALGLTKISKDIDADVSLECHKIITNDPYIDELAESDNENLLIIARQIRTLFTELCTLINAKQSEIQTAYEELVNNLGILMNSSNSQKN